jgi:hydrogenase/urease accessory protein HupE
MLLLATLFVSGTAQSHQMRTGYLDIKQLTAQQIQIGWHATVPTPMPNIDLDENCQFDARSEMSIQRSITCVPDIFGHELQLTGIGAIVSEVLIRVSFLDGREHTELLSADAPNFTLPAEPQSGVAAFFTYTKFGIEHLLQGPDHLLFLIALFLLVRRAKDLLYTASLFTVAHSITLALVVLDVVRLNPRATEACIALSLVLIAQQLVRTDSDETRRDLKSWMAMAFGFGLVHGLGFAGVLDEIGLPENAVALALAGFNVGIEIGQLLFLLICLVLAGIVEPLVRLQRLRWVGGYVVGVMGAFWLLQRL